MKQQSYDVNVESFEPLIAPSALKQELPMTETDVATVISSRATIEKILRREDERMLVITGPCSIHDDKAALEYAEKLRALSRRVEDQLYLVLDILL